MSRLSRRQERDLERAMKAMSKIPTAQLDALGDASRFQNIPKIPELQDVSQKTIDLPDLSALSDIPDISTIPDIPDDILKQNIPYVCDDCGEFVCVCEAGEETASGGICLICWHDLEYCECDG